MPLFHACSAGAAQFWRLPVTKRNTVGRTATPPSSLPAYPPRRQRALSAVSLGHRASRSCISPTRRQRSSQDSAMTGPRKEARRPASSSSGAAAKSARLKAKAPPARPFPSSSVILLSPTNEVLLLHRVQASNSFPSAHVFPGGHISSFHEPDFPPGALSADDAEYHRDSLAYRLAAIRETFEESGILLAKPKDSHSHHQPSPPAQAPLVALPTDVLATARTAVHGETVQFGDFLDAHGARPCTDELIPFTRWITPAWNKGRRFTTQMYLFLMPLAAKHSSSSSSSSPLPPEEMLENIITPTSDGGIEHTAATFATPAEWLRQQVEGRIILFPPQCFLLTLIATVFDAVEHAGAASPLPSTATATTTSTTSSSKQALYAAQRQALLEFVNSRPATTEENAHPTALIPWTEKVMSPEPLFTRESDRRLVLGVDKPGLELKGSGRGGDFERVVLVHFKKEGPRNVEVRQRADVLREEKEKEGTPKTTKL